MYIDVETTGSIRDRLYPDGLKRLRVPELSADQQAAMFGVAQRVERDLNVSLARATEDRSQINDRVRDLIIGAGRTSPIEKRFTALAAEWERATVHVSSYSEIVSDPTYESIIRLGPAVLPLILDRLRSEPMFWFSALERITGERPIEQARNLSVSEAADAWLAWGRQKGLIEA